MPVNPKDPRWKAAHFPPFDPSLFNKVPADAAEVKALLTKHMEAANQPEGDLIPLHHQFEKTQPEVAKYLDEAIELFAKARAALSHARSRLK